MKHRLLSLLAVALAYMASGWLSLQASIPPDYISVIFIPAGVAMVAVLVGGPRLLPAVWAGALGVQWLAMQQTGHTGPVWPLLVQPVGATLQAWVTAAWVRRRPGYPSALDHPWQALQLLFVCAPLGSLLNASLSVPALLVSGIVDSGQFWFSWWIWWMGDTLGVVLFTPLLLALLGQPRDAWRPRILTVAMPMVLALGLVAVVFHELNRGHTEALRQELNKTGHDLAQRLQRRLDAQTDAVVAIGTLMQLAPHLTPGDFEAATRPWLARYPGTQNFGWSPQVLHPDRAAFEQRHHPILGRDTSGRTYPAPTAAGYLPIQWVEPRLSNRAVLGLDVGVLPATAATVAAAQRSRLPAVTPALRLVQEAGEQRGIVVYQAVYAADATGSDPLRGVVSAVFRMDDVVASALGPLPSDQLTWCLTDEQGGDENRHLAGTPGCAERRDARRWHVDWPLRIADRPWRLHIQAQPAFWNRGQQWSTWVTTATALAAVAMLGTFLIAITGQNRRTSRLVQERTQELAQSNAHLSQLAHFDPLTGLANRPSWMAQAEAALAAARQREHPMAIAFLDLDRFKHVNDSLGHSQGDVLLQTVAQRICDCLRARDVVARFGGDEFVLLLPSLKGRGGAAVAMDKVVQALARPVALGAEDVTVTVSMGVAMYPEDGLTVGELLRHADTAMYTVKSAGRNGWRFFSQDMHERVSQRLTIESGLRRALLPGADELRLEYQPLVDARTGQVQSLEALLRWEHPEWGRVAPNDFIPVAEETGLIGGLGQWVLQEVCRQVHAWENAADPWLPPHLAVAVNVSAQEFNQPTFITQLQQTLTDQGMRPARLELELTESLLLQAGDELLQRLDTLTAMGIGLALDDFGTGYSSLGYLKRLPLNKLKIDRSFVQDVPGNAEDEAIIRATLSMAHDLGLRVVAEGVENEAQRDFLAHHRCDLYQGWLYGRSMPPEDLPAWVRAHQARVQGA